MRRRRFRADLEMRHSSSGKAPSAVARRQIAKALEALEDRSPSDQVIHDARKELKKARATLRLLRDALGDTVYRRENEAYGNGRKALAVAQADRTAAKLHE